jgi:hypothetical protein
VLHEVHNYEPASQVLPRGGTLVVPVPCVEGIVVCADKRQNDTATGFMDDRRKVHDIPGPAVLAHYGDTTLVCSTGKVVLYDGAVSALKFLKQNKIGFDAADAPWRALAKAIQRSFLDAFIESPVLAQPPKEHLEFTLLLFWFARPAP